MVNNVSKYKDLILGKVVLGTTSFLMGMSLFSFPPSEKIFTTF